MHQGEEAASRVIVIGAGVAGLSAAISAADNGARVTIVERADEHEAGGLTRWTAAYLRLDEIDRPAEGFVEDMLSFSGGRTPRWYAERLAERIPSTMSWAQQLGAEFDRLPTYFINSSRGRLQPVGGGKSILDAFLPAALARGITIRYHTTAERLITREGRVTGVEVTGDDGAQTFTADAVIVASGGFEGNPELLRRELGPRDREVIPIAPGARFNRGEGIEMAIAAGTARSGAWDDFHAEPVDPRADHAEAIVMGFPYGILVDRDGKRFIDEGRGTIDETYEETARRIWNLPGGIAYLVTDQHYSDDVARGAEGILSRVDPVTADTLPMLAERLGVPSDALTTTVETFNDATDDTVPFSWESPDGKATSGIEPGKSNWAFALDRPPYLAYPIVCAIVFTYGGLSTDEHGRALSDAGRPIPGLYAAGECTGIYHGKYPGGTSVIRGMVFGRLAGAAAAGAQAE